MAKRKAIVQHVAGRAARGKKVARGPRIDHLIARHRIEVIEAVLQRLQAVEPDTFARLDKQRNKFTRHRRRVDEADLLAPERQRGSTERQHLGQLLRARRKRVASIRDVIGPNLSLITALEDQCLPDRGFVGELTSLFNSGNLAPQPAPLQKHHRPKRDHNWQSSVVRCAAKCHLAGAECIEPAIVACIRILRTLRELVDDDGVPTKDEAAVFDAYARLRTPARRLLELLDRPKSCTLEGLADEAKVNLEYFRHVSGPLKALGYVREHGNHWSRTHEGEQLLRS